MSYVIGNTAFDWFSSHLDGRTHYTGQQRLEMVSGLAPSGCHGRECACLGNRRSWQFAGILRLVLALNVRSQDFSSFLGWGEALHFLRLDLDVFRC